MRKSGRRLVGLSIQPLAGQCAASRRRCPACDAWAWSLLGVVYSEAQCLALVCTPFCEQCGAALDDYLSDADDECDGA